MAQHELDQHLRPARAADLGGPAGQRLVAQPAQQAAAAEGQVDDHGHAALGRQRQQALLGFARVERVVDLQEVELLGAQHRLDLAVGRRGVVRDADVAHAALVLPAAQGREVRAPVDQVVHLHQVDALGAQAREGLLHLRDAGLAAARSRPWWRGRPWRAGSMRPAGRRWSASERPYIGELSITVPPAANRASSTPGSRWYSALPGATSKPIQVPQPTTGRASCVEGMGRVFIFVVFDFRGLGEGRERPRGGKRQRQRPGAATGCG